MTLTDVPTHDGAIQTRETCAWLRAHETLSRLAKSRAELDWEEGRGLLAAQRSAVHRHLGFGSFFEYIESLFGYKPRSIEEKLRVAEALEALPTLSEDLRRGALTWSAVRELTRVATAETEQTWREAAFGKSAREIQERVSGRLPGDNPDSPAHPGVRRHILTFEVRAETLATFREALAKLRRTSGEPLDEETALLLMARQILAGPSDPGRASYQIALTLCEHCGAATQQGRVTAVQLDSAIAQMASCDAQYLANPNSTSGDPREATSAPFDPPITDPDDAHVGARTIEPIPKPHHSRATQSIPPRVRRHVLRRDHGCCVVPGCRNAVFVDVHHLHLRAEGGGHDPETLVVLCSAHHRAVHRGHLIAQGTTVRNLTFRHADGSPYRHLDSAHAAAAQTRAFSALRKLGFREGDVRRALAQLPLRDPRDHEDVELIVRTALRSLTSALSSTACAAP